MSDYDDASDKADDESYKDERTLRELYHGEGLSQSEIGDQFGVSGTAIGYWMDEYDVDTRSQSEAQTDDDAPYRDEELLRELYLDKQFTISEIAERFGCSEWPINKAMDEFDIERRDPSEFQRIRWDDEADHEPLTEDRLRGLYVDQQLSTRAVAEEIGCGRQKVESRLDEYGIEQRSMREAAYIRNSREPASFDVTKAGYERWKAHVDGEHLGLFVHRLAAVAWFGWDAVVDRVVHHENGHKRDNREENLELMTNRDHSKMHADRGEIGFFSVGNQHSPPPEER